MLTSPLIVSLAIARGASRASWIVRLLAFLQRAIARWLGSRVYEFGEATEARSARYLGLLRSAHWIELALEHLRLEQDLLVDEAALGEQGLELQLLLIELAAERPVAAELVRQMLIGPPVSRLLSAVLTQAKVEGVSDVRFRTPPPGALALCVDFGQEGAWREAMRIPTTLADPLRGCLARLDHGQYEKVKPYLPHADLLPEHVQFRWAGEDLTLKLGPIH